MAGTTFSFYNDDNSKINRVNIKANTNWTTVAKSVNNTYLNSVWKLVDNGDGVIQQNEADLMCKMFTIADKSVKETSNDKVIDNNELSNLLKKINNGSLKKELDTRVQGSIEVKNAEYKNFSYIDNVKNKNNSINNRYIPKSMEKTEPKVINVDYTELNKLTTGEYYISEYNREQNEDGTYTETPQIYKKQKSGQGKTTSWSEGLDRQIESISLAAIDPATRQGSRLSVVKNELKTIGKELGFEVNEIYMEEGPWIEDYGIRRADGKVLVPSKDVTDRIKSNKKNLGNVIEDRKDISKSYQGKAANYASEFENSVQRKDIVHSKSYLEGGNVLNTCLPDGTPAAVIGSESIAYTLEAMGLERNDENIEIAKNQIAQDLGLKPENITFIPQYDFHIDMLYRPLHNGEMAVPDYDAGIKILKETNIKGMDPRSKQRLLSNLEYLKNKSAQIRQEAEQKLTQSGYKLVKIPCFNERADSKINFMNGIGGTTKDGKTFYITNNSTYPELNDIVVKYFNNAGVDKVYFVSTDNFLYAFGGIDCLTQEI